MCHSCTLLHLDRCPPANPEPAPAVADQIAFEADVESGLRPPDADAVVVDAVTELVLRAQLDRRPAPAA